MTLTPIKKSVRGPRLEPIFKSADPEFNHKAAKAAYEMVMKMDDDAAAVFTEIVVADAVEELIEKNLEKVQKRLNEVIDERANLIRKGMARRAVKDAASVLGHAQAFALIEKARGNPYAYGYQFDESDFNRDRSTGRFRAKVTHTQKQPLNDKTAEAMGIPKARVGLSRENKAQYQDEYRQLAAFLGTVYESTNAGDVQVGLHFEDNTGKRFVQSQTGTYVSPEQLNPKEKKLIGIEAKPATLNVGGAAFGLQSSLSRPQVEGINAGAEKFPSFAESWVGAGNARNDNQKLYSRIGEGSKFVGAVAPYSEKAQIASAFGQFVGGMGPEAEKVIGPTARKTAYRYRGTEKTPDKDLVSLYGPAINRGKMDSFADRNLSMSQMAAARQSAQDRAPAWGEREHGRRVVAEHLWNPDRRPNQRLYALQLASGNTPPSEGVLINREGQIVAQAVGYGDDHYLPFNLKNLKALKGGEYIRTRSVGGLTSEDIYTGLISGARQVTVVSRSGTFTMEFEEDFRGGRRHNDKARRMTRRYEQILDAVQSEKVDRQDVSPEIRTAITRQVNEEYGGEPAGERRRLITERIEEFKKNPEFSQADEDLASMMVRMHTAGSSSRDTASVRADIMNQLAAEKEYKFRLNGDGYAAALKALEEQFPYYIKVRSVPTRNEGRAELERDKGYVEPARNRPTEAQAGWYGTAQNPGKKFSASQANYQRGRYGVKSDEASENPPETRTAEAAANVTSTPGKPRKDAEEPEKVAQRIREVRAKGDAAGAMREAARKAPFDQATKSAFPAIFEMSDDEFGSAVGQQETLEQIDRFADSIRKAKNEGKPIPEPLSAAVLKFKAAAAATGKYFSEGTKFQWPTSPYEFTKTDGPAYKASPNLGDVQRETALIGQRFHSVSTGKPLNELSMDELKTELGNLRDIEGVRKLGSTYRGEDRRRLMTSLGLDPTTGTKAINEDEGQFNKRVRAIHQMRYLKTAGEGPNGTKKMGPVGPTGTLREGTAEATEAEESVSWGAENYTRLAAAKDDLDRLYSRSNNPTQIDEISETLADIQDAMDTDPGPDIVEEIIRRAEAVKRSTTR